MSKRKLKQLVKQKIARGWDDPRLFTLNGLRRRGYTPEGINDFCNRVGISRNTNTIDIGLLEECCRQNLNDLAKRKLVVMHPLRVTLINYPAGQVEYKDADDFPQDAERGSHKVPFSRILYIDREDFRQQNSEDYFGLAPGKQVYLKYAYTIKCESVRTDATGNVVELLASVDFDKSADLPKGKIQWVAEPQPGQEPLRVTLRLYDRFFKSEDPSLLGKEWLSDSNPQSFIEVKAAYAEPSLSDVKAGDKFQFERVGFFVVDLDTEPNSPVFNRTVKLKDSRNKPSKKDHKD